MLILTEIRLRTINWMKPNWAKFQDCNFSVRYVIQIGGNVVNSNLEYPGTFPFHGY